MARNFFSLTNSAAVALVAATEKTVLQLTAGANVRAALQALMLTFDGNSGSATPAVIKLVRQTTAGTGTSRVLSKKDNDIASALQSAGAENFTVEPTQGDILEQFHIHPQAGAQIPLPMPGEYIVPAGARVALTVKLPAGATAVNCLAKLEGEE